MHSCLFTLLDSGVKGVLSDQECSDGRGIDVLAVHVCAKGMNTTLLP